MRMWKIKITCFPTESLKVGKWENGKITSFPTNSGKVGKEVIALIYAGLSLLQGDSGSPVVQYSGGRAVLVGVMAYSSVQGECIIRDDIRESASAVRVSPLINWIVDTINQYNWLLILMKFLKRCKPDLHSSAAFGQSCAVKYSFIV